MDSGIEIDRTLLRRARVAYEWSRARRAMLGFLPVLILVGVSWALGSRPAWSLGFGVAVFAMGATLLWYGRDLKQAVLPGVVAGMVPLLLVLCAMHVGHVCTGGSCTDLCMQACAVGGLVAGLAVASVGNARRAGVGFWLAASALTILTGSMACACLGVAGIGGLAIGYGAGLVPGLVRRFFAPLSN